MKQLISWEACWFCGWQAGFVIRDPGSSLSSDVTDQCITSLEKIITQGFQPVTARDISRLARQPDSAFGEANLLGNAVCIAVLIYRLQLSFSTLWSDLAVIGKAILHWKNQRVSPHGIKISRNFAAAYLSRASVMIHTWLPIFRRKYRVSTTNQ